MSIEVALGPRRSPAVEAKRSGNGSGQINEEQTPYRTAINETKKVVAQSIEGIVQRYQKIVDWQNQEDVSRSMRRDIKRELRPLGDRTETELDEMVRTMVEVARRRLAQ